jgi:transcriptional regulator with XRE-family HTH domain
MSIQSERIKSEMLRNSLTLVEIEQRTGIKKSSMQRYVSGETGKIPMSAIEKLAKLFDVPAAYLMGWDKKKDSPSEPTLTEGEKKVLELFRLIPEERQGYALEVLETLLKMQQKP